MKFQWKFASTDCSLFRLVHIRIKFEGMYRVCQLLRVEWNYVSLLVGSSFHLYIGNIVRWSVQHQFELLISKVVLRNLIRYTHVNYDVNFLIIFWWFTDHVKFVQTHVQFICKGNSLCRCSHSISNLHTLVYYNLNYHISIRN